MPELVNGFENWVQFTQQVHQLHEQRKQIGLEAQVTALTEELSQTNKYYEQRLANAECDRLKLVQQLGKVDEV